MAANEHNLIINPNTVCKTNCFLHFVRSSIPHCFLHFRSVQFACLYDDVIHTQPSSTPLLQKERMRGVGIHNNAIPLASYINHFSSPSLFTHSLTHSPSSYSSKIALRANDGRTNAAVCSSVL
jgi:hypothetical protein